MIGHWLGHATKITISKNTCLFILGQSFHFQTPKWTISRATSHFQPNSGICFGGSHLIRISRLLCSSAMDISATVKRWRRPETLGVEQRDASLCVAGQDLIPWGYSIGYTVVREIWWEWTKNMIFIAIHQLYQIIMLFAKWGGCIDICTVHFSDCNYRFQHFFPNKSGALNISSYLLATSLLCWAWRRCCRRFHGFVQKHFQVATLVSWAWACLRSCLDDKPWQTTLYTWCWLNIWKWE